MRCHVDVTPGTRRLHLQMVAASLANRLVESAGDEPVNQRVFLLVPFIAFRRFGGSYANPPPATTCCCVEDQERVSALHHS